MVTVNEQCRCWSGLSCWSGELETKRLAATPFDGSEGAELWHARDVT